MPPDAMSEVTVTINGRDYQVACDEGQEEQLLKLARYVDLKMADLKGSLGQIGDARLLVMSSLLIADGLSDAYQRIDDLESAGDEADPSSLAARDETLAATLEACARKIEDIASRLEHA